MKKTTIAAIATLAISTPCLAAFHFTKKNDPTFVVENWMVALPCLLISLAGLAIARRIPKA